MAVTLAANALTSVAAAKAHLGECISGKEKLLINRASQLIETAAQRSFGVAEIVDEKVKGYGDTRLLVLRTPIKSVTEIKFCGDVVDLTNVEIEQPERVSIVRQGGWRWTAHNVNDISRSVLPGTELADYEVTYRGGYVLPWQDGDAGAPVNGDARDLPFDLEYACLELMRRLHAIESRDPTVQSERLMSWSATYNPDMGILSGMVGDTIAAYRRCVI